MTPDDADVKALLGRALAGEPPLTLDRDEVFRQGRRKLRNRRYFSAGGAIAGAVVAVVGAVVLTGLVAEEPTPKTPPAATRTERHAPPGPTLPLTTTPQPPSKSVPAASPEHADALTQVLFGSGAFPATLKPHGSSAFVPIGDTYELKADMISPDADGSLSVSVGAADPAGEVDCARLPDARDGCEVITERDVTVAVGQWRDYQTGEKRYVAYAVHADGTSVTAISSNLSGARRGSGAPPASKIPVVDKPMLTKIVALPELRYVG